jgi:hypothetical protein
MKGRRGDGFQAAGVLRSAVQLGNEEKNHMIRLAMIILFGVIGHLPVSAGEESESIPPEHQVILKGQWTPTKDQTEKALMATAIFVRKIASQPAGKTFAENYKIGGAAKISRQMATYVVQFIGKVRNGKKVIFCSFFATVELKNFSRWKESEPMVDGGGYDFWQVYYDPETEKCDDFQVNEPE